MTVADFIRIHVLPRIDRALAPSVEQYTRADSTLLGSITNLREEAQVTVGNRTYIGIGTAILCANRIVIGDDVLISTGCVITDNDAHSTVWSKRASDVTEGATRRPKMWDSVGMAPITICDKVWIGYGVIILKGVTIGEGAVIGAGSVVTKDIPPWTIAAGNPARAIRAVEP